ncbi:putative arylsulfatase precursor [Cutaneotrichosporon oleaginosum]|uniref:Arylsulfatase n=1 Tax=Cutaneotrichosporon oleaginosum TaxID=879819 RepID=A0A0J0XSB1_9TREE|nr:putative arylsulfatase precursor [Cutaneotrichosporon oleaginosum]KLT43955.1 putative arylsulfatase precursor [Cutaneotrichosporon oleaginosum]TXT04098.1 hypothetical protein COLE_07795 [Cutaneotrichosporon oleaginosum]
MLAHLALCLLGLVAAGGDGGHGHGHGKGKGPKKPASKPNIVLFITDDQDVGTHTREIMPRTFERLVDHGVNYENFFTPVSLCCPSRVSLLRTQAAHNHNITFVELPHGGWQKFNDYGYVSHTLPDFLQAVGYNTYYVGKYMNDHTVKNCVELPVSGFNASDILVDPYTYDYWRPAFSVNNGPAEIHNGSYSTDLVGEKSLRHLDTALAADEPFFIGIAPIGPHSYMDSSKRESSARLYMDTPEWPERHAHMFMDAKVPRTENFNPDEPMGVSWVKTLPKLNESNVEYIDEFYRGRLRSLQSVDELVGQVMDKLEAAGVMENTYVFYTADNGFAMGSHRRQPGKTLGYEDDIKVPLVIRGPGMPEGKTDTVSSYGMVDLSRTFLDLAGAKPDYEDDGTKINLHLGEGNKADRTYEKHRHSLSEYWLRGIEEGKFVEASYRDNNTYRTLRVHDEVAGQPVTYSYAVWCTGERELYDLVEDPYQVRNLLAGLNDVGPFAAFDAGDVPEDRQRLLHRLDALTLVLKTCKGESCVEPYGALFPQGRVSTLQQAMNRKYDEFFAALPKVHFDHCMLGFQNRLELPEWDNAWAYKK